MSPLPDKYMENKSPLSRQKFLKRQFETHRKSKRLYFSWLMIIGIFGAHRAYLGQYKIAAILCFIGVGCLFFLDNLQIVSSNAAYKWLPYLPFFIVVIELIMLPFSVWHANSRIRLALANQTEIVPFVRPFG